MDLGDGDKYKGKSLSEIQIDPETEEAFVEEDNEDDDAVVPDNESSVENIISNFQRPSSSSAIIECE